MEIQSDLPNPDGRRKKTKDSPEFSKRSMGAIAICPPKSKKRAKDV